MKFFPMLRANLFRSKKRTFLTVASVALALFLFASLRTVVTTLANNSQFGSARRLVVTNRTGFVIPLPVAYANRIQALPGVESVTWANWFGGQYGDGKEFFATFAISAETYLGMYPEMTVPDDQKAAFMQDRSGALVGQRLLALFGWKVGQTITLRGTIFPGDWTFTIRGIYTPTDKSIDDRSMMFHWEYLDQYLQDQGNGRGGIAGWYIVQIADLNDAPHIGKAIDDMFISSPDPTKTGTEKAFNASFANMWGNVSLLMNTIGMAVVFAILLVTANAMMMSARERTREVAVLKTIGFSDGRLFALVLTEAGLISMLGAAIGLGAAKFLYSGGRMNPGGFLPGFDLTTSTMLSGGAIALVLMLASGIVPAWRAARLPVIQALRSVE
jgi:putative ABC transport system permease protein